MDRTRNKMLPILNPSPMSFKQFEAVMEEITSKINIGIDIEMLLYNYENTPYYFKKDNTYFDGQDYVPSIKDVAHFYVLINYLATGQLENAFDRHKSFEKFFSNQWDEIKEFIYDTMMGNETDRYKNIEVDIVSGSIYKIKKYFLENNKIKDIRGASAIIKYLNEDVTLSYLEDKYIKECAIYCGGGNVLILVQKGQGHIICKELEEKYTKISLTAQNAFEYITCDLNTLMTQYNSKMGELNRKLQERKKIKLYHINPDNDLSHINMEGKNIYFNEAKRVEQEGIVCELCSVRDGKYKIPTAEGTIIVCPSCLRKNSTGRYKAIFYEEYTKFTGAFADAKVGSINDLGDKENRVAVIYADGNNMGDVIRRIENPFQHMYFSRNLDYITKNCVYKSIHNVMGNNAKFEAIALGGDDIFIIVPADTSLEITNGIITEFDKAFEYTMTMSAGICIAKSTTPLQSMFEIAQHMLKNAKRLSRENTKPEGTIDIEIIQSNMSVNPSRSKSNVFPATNTQLYKFIQIIKELKNDEDIKISQLYKLNHASRVLASSEFQLFYLYQVNRTSSKYTYYVSKLFDQDSGCFCGFIQYYDEQGNKKEISPWQDIILLQNCIGGEQNEAYKI